MFDNAAAKVTDMYPFLPNQFLPHFHYELDFSSIKVVQRRGDCLIIPSCILHKVIYWASALNVDTRFFSADFDPPAVLRRNDDLYFPVTVTNGYTSERVVAAALAGRSNLLVRTCRHVYEYFRLLWLEATNPIFMPRIRANYYRVPRKRWWFWA